MDKTNNKLVQIHCIFFFILNQILIIVFCTYRELQTEKMGQRCTYKQVLHIKSMKFFANWDRNMCTYSCSWYIVHRVPFFGGGGGVCQGQIIIKYGSKD